MKVRLLIKLFVILVLATSYANPANALQESVPMAGDHRIRTYTYGPQEVYIYRGTYKYSSRIDLDPTETIQTISLGDSTGWMINPSGSRIFLKPIEVDATTNMIIITDKRVYYFELYAEEAENIRDKDISFSTTFVYPDSTSSPDGIGSFYQFYNSESNIPTQKEIKKNPGLYNFNYSISGSKDISPLEVFDDGEFTYFKFKDVNADVPALFQVLSDGNESLINYRVSDGYVIVERVISQYTLRHGKLIACVFNEARPLDKEVLPPEKRDDDKKYWLF